VSDVTRVLEAIQQGDPKAADQLLPLVYQELRKLAAHKMANETASHTLQPTALVHEAWLKLVGEADRKYRGRDHFFAAAAEAMRRILIDNARRKLARRHGGDQQRLDVMDIQIPEGIPDDKLLALNDALEKLAALDQQKAELVKLRFFVGLTLEESAKILGYSVPTAKRHWAFALAWLYQEIEADQAK
jgi:RNA polymerase sigma factor (TIGR02999 family)